MFRVSLAGRSGQLRNGVCIALLCLVSACASHQTRVAHRGPGNYAPPGPPGDPWGPYIVEASRRFGVPDRWVREVMRQESGGQQYLNGRPTTSWAGAMGLMQVIPSTYDTLRQRYGLGDDPFDPHDNIMAGTAYIREMYEKYGSPGFLAAYNAGPGRVDSYLAGSQPLPNETVNYVASIAPRLGNDRPMSGPLAVYASAVGGAAPPSARRAYASSGAAPSRRGEIVDPESFVPVYVVPVAETQAASAAHSPPPPPAQPRLADITVAEYAPPEAPVTRPASAATPPSPRSEPAPPPTQNVQYRLVPVSPGQAQAAVASAYPIPPASGGWAVQVGAFNSPQQAREAAERARSLARLSAQPVVGAVSRPDGGALFRARLTGLSPDAAERGCQTLRGSGVSCIVLPPDRAS